MKAYKGNVVLTPNAMNGLEKESEILTFHIRSVSKSRLGKKIGSISEEQLQNVIQGLNDILRY